MRFDAFAHKGKIDEKSFPTGLLRESHKRSPAKAAFFVPGGLKMVYKSSPGRLLGPSWGPLGPSWVALGSLLRGSWALLGVLGALLEGCWTILRERWEASGPPRRSDDDFGPSKGRFWTFQDSISDPLKHRFQVLRARSTRGSALD